MVCDVIAGTDNSLFLAGNYTANYKMTNLTETLTGNNNSFIVKLDNNGNLLWQTHIISSGYSNISSLSCDSNGAVYACGTFKGSLNIENTTLDTSRVKSLFILKLNKAGEVEMLQQIAGNFSNRHISITNNSKNELLLVASFKGNIKTGIFEHTSNYYSDILIAKFNNSGKLDKANILHGKMNDMINDIACTGEDDIFITGSFKMDLLFGDKIMKTTKNSDAFLIKLNDELKFVYGKQIGGIYDDYGKSISIDNNGNILLVGSFAGEVILTGGNTLTSNGVLDVFVIKYDEDGNLIWAESFGGGANDYASSMTLSPSGNIYINGTYRGAINKDNFKIESSDFSNDIFLAKYNAAGKFRFLETAGGINVDFGRRLISDTEGYIYLSGDFSESLKLLDKETTEAVDNDFFIARLYDCEESTKVKLPADTSLCTEQYIIFASENFSEYFWNGQPGNHELIIDSTGVYTIEVIDEHGCVSEDTIIVNLFSIPTFDLGDTIYAHRGELITIEAPTGMEEYLWSDGSTLSFLNVNTGFLDAGNYDYLVEIEDENSCREADGITLIVLDDGVLADNLVYKDYGEETLNVNADNDSGEMIVNVFPNPARDKILISIQKLIPGSDLQLQILSDLSKEVWIEKLHIKHDCYEKQLDITTLEPGIYLLKIEYETYEKLFKIVKI
jgi:hypothetical protein